MNKKVIAIDFGMKRCGLAISSETKTMALPWTTVSLDKVASTIQKRQNEIEKIIVGLPLLLSGKKGEMASIVESFAKALEKTLQIPVELIDERLSSKHAESALRETGQCRKKRTEKTDEVTATLLLDGYLSRTAFNT